MFDDRFIEEENRIICLSAWKPNEPFCAREESESIHNALYPRIRLFDIEKEISDYRKNFILLNDNQNVFSWETSFIKIDIEFLLM